MEELTQKNSASKDDMSKLENDIACLQENLKINEEIKTKSLARIAEIESDLEVMTNDKEVLESERKRIEGEKNELSLDLV